MTYACPAWEFTADTHLMKLQHLQNKVLCTTDTFPRNTILDMHISLQIPYEYDYTSYNQIMQATSPSHSTA
jgi:hypothetical protein